MAVTQILYPFFVVFGAFLGFTFPELFIVSGFITGYIGAKLCGFGTRDAKTVAIEVGMQNSGLATVIAIKHFTMLASLIPVLFSVLQNVYGIIIFPVCKPKENKAENIERIL